MIIITCRSDSSGIKTRAMRKAEPELARAKEPDLASYPDVDHLIKPSPSLPTSPIHQDDTSFSLEALSPCVQPDQCSEPELEKSVTLSALPDTPRTDIDDGSPSGEGEVSVDCVAVRPAAAADSCVAICHTILDQLHGIMEQANYGFDTDD